MDQRQRRNEEESAVTGGAGAGNPGGNLGAMRQQAAGLQAAADAAIKSVLSGDSQAFNSAMRQEGGE